MTELRDNIEGVCGECFKNEIDDVQAAARILAIIHGDAEPVAWRWDAGAKWAYFETVPASFPAGVAEPLYTAPPTVTREQVEAIGTSIVRQLNENLKVVPTAETRAFSMETALTDAGIPIESEGE